jgi:hypothetical protein
LILVCGVALVVHAFTTTPAAPFDTSPARRASAEHQGRRTRRRPISNPISESAFDLPRPFRDYEEAEAQRRTSLYLGCRVQAVGYASGPTFIGLNIGQDVALSRRPNTAPVVYSFFAPNEPRPNWRAGEKMSVEGTVHDIGQHVVVLTDCVSV